MKKNLLIALFAAAALAPVAAQAERGYVGVNAGRTQQKASVDGFEGSAKEKTTTVKAYGGFQFTPVFGIEGGLVEMGKIKEEDEGEMVSIRPRSLYVAATGTLQLKERLALFAKVGAAHTETKMTIEGFGSETIDKTGLMYGVGISYAFTPTIWGVAEYEDFGKIVKQDGITMKAASLTFGVRFKF